MSLPQENKKYTFADYLSWGKDERIEIIDGEVIVAQAAPSPVHQDVVMRITRQIANYLEGKRYLTKSVSRMYSPSLKNDRI